MIATNGMAGDRDWYEVCDQIYGPVSFAGKLVAEQDERCRRICEMAVDLAIKV